MASQEDIFSRIFTYAYKKYPPAMKGFRDDNVHARNQLIEELKDFYRDTPSMMTSIDQVDIDLLVGALLTCVGDLEAMADNCRHHPKVLTSKALINKPGVKMAMEVVNKYINSGKR